MALFNLLKENINKDISISLVEDKDNMCHFILLPVNDKVDITYMKGFYNKIKMNLYSHNYIAEVKLYNNGVYIKFQ